MHITFKRSIDPATFEYAVTFDESDVALAFFEHADPDEDLFFQLYSPQWSHLSGSQQLLALSRAAALAESAQQATNLNLAASPPQPK